MSFVKTIWVETDLESDDVLAILLLSAVKYYVVGEGDSNMKYKRMNEYAKLSNNESAIIIEGIGSKTKFSMDGKEFDKLPDVLQCNENYLLRFIEFANSDNPIMFSFKPMRELIQEYIKNPELTTKLLSNITLYCYGGFNFRCLFSEYKKELLEVLHLFKRVNIYESFFVSGSDNSVNKNTMPGLYKIFKEKNNKPYYTALSKLIYNWNVDIKERFTKSIQNPELDDDSKKRHQKVLDNIGDHLDFQMVLADFGLAAIYDKIEPKPIKNLSFTNYTQFEWINDTQEKTNLYAYHNIKTDLIEKHIIKKLE